MDWSRLGMGEGFSSRLVTFRIGPWYRLHGKPDKCTSYASSLAQSLGLKIQTIDGTDPSSTALPTIQKSSPLHIDFSTQKHWGSPYGFAQTLWLGLQEMKCKSHIWPNPTSSCPFGTNSWVFLFKTLQYCVCVGWVMFSSVFHRFQNSLANMHPICSLYTEPFFEPEMHILQGLWCADTAHFPPLWHPSQLQRQPKKEIKSQSTSTASPTRKHHVVFDKETNIM